jgi:hypothetical protein
MQVKRSCTLPGTEPGAAAGGVGWGRMSAVERGVVSARIADLAGQLAALRARLESAASVLAGDRRGPGGER